MLAPVALMLGVAIQPNPDGLDLDPLVSSAEANDRINKYLEPVRLAEAALTNRSLTDSELRSVAEYWISKSEEGILLPLPAQGSEDGIQLGVKGQILQASKDLSFELSKVASASAKRGDYDSAARDFTSAALVTQSLRYSDASAISIVGSHQRRMLRLLAEIWPKASDATKEELLPKLERMAPDEKQFDLLVKMERRNAVVDEAWRAELERASGTASSTSIDLRRIAAGPMSNIIRLATINDRESAKLIAEMLGTVEDEQQDESVLVASVH